MICVQFIINNCVIICFTFAARILVIVQWQTGSIKISVSISEKFNISKKQTILLFFQNIIPTKCTALDFERYIQENKTLLLNDPLREILLYPTDDVSVSVIYICTILSAF